MVMIKGRVEGRKHPGKRRTEMVDVVKNAGPYEYIKKLAVQLDLPCFDFIIKIQLTLGQ